MPKLELPQGDRDGGGGGSRQHYLMGIFILISLYFFIQESRLSSAAERALYYNFGISLFYSSSSLIK